MELKQQTMLRISLTRRSHKMICLRPALEESSPRNAEPEPPMNVSPPKEQQQQEAPMAPQLEEEVQPEFSPLEAQQQPSKEATAQQSEEEVPVDV
ncbi:hypothetical protein AHAS_Ahas15G0247400 [Arachis hypogaea]